MKLSVLCQCSPLSCAPMELGSPGSTVPTARALSWSQPCSLQRCLCPCRARCCGHSTHTTPGMGSTPQSPGFLAASQCCQCQMGFPLPLHERKNNLKNNFELIRGELSVCFYGAPHEFLAPGGCQHHLFPEGDFFPSPCREAAAPSSAPSCFKPSSHALSSTAELCLGHADGHLGAGQSQRELQH